MGNSNSSISSSSSSSPGIKTGKGKDWAFRIYYDPDASSKDSSYKEAYMINGYRILYDKYVDIASDNDSTDPDSCCSSPDMKVKYPHCLMIRRAVYWSMSKNKDRTPGVGDYNSRLTYDDAHDRDRTITTTEMNTETICSYHYRQLDDTRGESLACLLGINVAYINSEALQNYWYTADELSHIFTNMEGRQGEHIIDRVMIYKTPLSESFWTNTLFYHAYIIFRSNDGKVTWWWSLEKNGTEICLQKSLDKDAVLNNLRHEPRLKSHYWYPKLLLEDEGSEMRLAELVEYIFKTRELENQYNVLKSNCKDFTETMFEKLAKREKWAGFWGQ